MRKEDFDQAYKIIESYAHRIYGDPHGNLNGDIIMESFVSYPDGGWRGIFSWIGVYASPEDEPVIFIAKSDKLNGTNLVHYEGYETISNPEADLRSRNMWRE